MVSLKAGLRACGNGSAATMRPTRMSTFRNSSNVICGVVERPWSMMPLCSDGGCGIVHVAIVLRGAASLRTGGAAPLHEGAANRAQGSAEAPQILGAFQDALAAPQFAVEARHGLGERR